ncbi:MAG: immunoglobulin domain-containing protein, partial [Verrucomicrobia bacterium]|nr:immunoglobulin domain-containing protein [Verrucomicrobiota bacterium]
MRLRPLLRRLRSAPALLVAALTLADAATVTLVPVRDTTIYSDGSTPLANAKGVSFFAGLSGQNRTLRALVKFDLAGQIPAGATVTGVTLTLAVTSPRSHPLTLGLHRLSADWGEGTSDASRGEGGGVAATAGDATWLLRFHDTAISAWTAAGGDFAATASATQTVPATTGNITITSAALASDVQAWLANPATNFGWLLRATDETAAAARFSSREGTAPPSLQITYTEPSVAPTITAQPQNTLVTAGQPATFSVTATGTATLTYQWRRNGLALASATNATYTIPTASRTDADYYDVAVTNSVGTTNSAVARLGVAPTSYPTLVAPDPAWQPQPESQVLGAYGTAVVPLADGRAYIAGKFASIDGVRRTGIARLTADGALDLTFTPPEIDNTVCALLVQPDGKIVIGGEFDRVDGFPRRFLARLNPDGTVDPGFAASAAPNAGGALNARVCALARQSDGKILVGGTFTQFAGATRDYLVRLHANGSLDTDFMNRGFNDVVKTIVVQSDDKVIVGGGFAIFVAAGGAATSRARLARLNADGSLDSTYAPTINGSGVYSVAACALQSDGALLVGGYFTSINGMSAGNIGRLSGAGGIDTTFSAAVGAGFNGEVRALTIDAQGRVLAGGYFSTFAGSTARSFARLNANGSRDSSYVSSGFTSGVDAAGTLPGGSILLGGGFDYYYQPSGATVLRARFARVNGDGTLASAVNFSLRSWGEIKVLVPLPTGHTLVGGFFKNLRGVAVPNNFMRLKPDGEVDAQFNFGGAGATSTTAFFPSVDAAVVQPDGKIFISGSFTHYNGAPVSGLLRLHPDGTPDQNFAVDPGFSGTGGLSLLLLPRGRILVAGRSHVVNNTQYYRIGVLTNSGAIDLNFAGATTDGRVHCAVLQPDGKIVIGGNFSTYNGAFKYAILRLNSDGTIDTSFSVGSGGFWATPYALALQPDGKILVGGWLALINDVGRSGLARLLSSGALDTSFAPPAQNTVNSIQLQEDGRILVHGDFSNIGGAPGTAHLARLTSDGARDTSFGAYGFAASANYFPSSLAITDAGRLFMTSVGARGASVSAAAALPAIATPPGSRTVAPGSSVAMSVVATSALPFTYQWYRGSTALSGATNASLTITSVQAADAGSYTVVVTNELGSTTSAAAILTVMVPITISVQPAGRSVALGLPATLSVTATSAASLTYQWRKGGTPIAGATNASLAFAAVQSSDAGSYDVVVTNSTGSVTSQPAALTVTNAPAVAAQPQSQSVNAGGSVTLSVTVGGLAPFTYQWNKDGAPIAGATDATLSLTAVANSATGRYTVTVTNSAGSATSDAAIVLVQTGTVSASGTHAVSGLGFHAGRAVVVANSVTHGGALGRLVWQVLLPAGWSLASTTATGTSAQPAAGATSLLEWTWTTVPASPVTFTYTLNAPADARATVPLAVLLTVQQSGNVLNALAQPDPLLLQPLHSADTVGSGAGTPPDGRLNLAELLRVIELYNHRAGTVRTGQYTLQDGTEDGFTAGASGAAL